MKNKGTATKKQDDWKGYVNWSPTVREREGILSLMGDEAYSPTDQLDTLNECGYATSFSYDEKNSCHRISVTGKTRPCSNIGYTLSIRASTTARCLGSAVYYIFTICEGGDWLVDKGEGESW